MALQFDSTLAGLLAQEPNKLAFSGLVRDSLTNTRVLRCWHDPAGGADASVNGVEFLNLNMSGPLTITAGNITGFGLAQGTNIRLAADLSTGTSALRVEGGGHYVQGTLGLMGGPTATDFTFTANPTTTSGFGFTPSAVAKAPRFLPSGTGPIAPGFTADTPTHIELEDWTNPNAPFVVGSLSFDTRVDDIVFEDAEMSAEIGDVRVYESTQSIIYRGFEFGAKLFIANQYNTSAGTTQLEQMLIGCKPHGRWSSYPAMDTFIRTTYSTTKDANNNTVYGACTNPTTYDSTYPPAFKINLKRADGSTIFTHETPAQNEQPACAINSDAQAQFPDSTHAMRVHWNCAMLLPWENQRTRMSSLAGKLYPGVTTASYSGRQGKYGHTVNPSVPLYDAYDQINSMNHLWAAPKWPLPLPYDQALADQYDPQTDPLLFNKNTYYPSINRLTGWGYAPGSISCHDWRTGNGGQRFDRYPIASILALYMGNPNYVRAQGNVPIRDMVDAWGKAYFNHSCFYLRDVRTFDTIPKQESLNGDWVFASAYYGGGPYGAQGQSRGPQNTIDLCGVGSGNPRTTGNNDATGRMPYGGWQLDSLHSYKQSGMYAILLNSPMHAFATRFDFNAQWMAALGESYPTADPQAFFMVRVQAWRWLTYVVAWKLSTRNSCSYSRAEIEARFQIELELMYDRIYVPAFVNNDQSVYMAAIRNLGAPCTQVGYSLNMQPGGVLGLYNGQVLVFLKQWGLWSVMKAKNDKCKTVLEMMLSCLDKFTVDYILDGCVRDPFYPQLTADFPPGYNCVGSDVPANWAAQKAIVDAAWPPRTDGNGLLVQQMSDWHKTSNGSFTAFEQAAQHMQAQWPSFHKLFFPEYVNPRLDAAIAKYKGYYDEVEAQKASGIEFGYRIPAMGLPNPPTVVGPN